MILLHSLYRLFTSLRFTVILLIFGMMLIFFGTLDQVEYGVYEVQKRYFESLFTYWKYPLQWVWGERLRWLVVPILGGYTLGGLLICNLLAAHFRYFQAGWKKVGIVVIHTGVLLLLVSGFATSFYQQESQMWIDVGGKNHYSENPQENEIVLIDKSETKTDHVFSIDVEGLKAGTMITDPVIPLDLEVLKLYPNSDIALQANNPNAPASLADQGAAAKMGLAVYPKPLTYKPNEINTVSAYVRISEKNGEVLGTWLISNLMDERFPPQKLEYEGKNYQIALRFKRTYFPFDLELKSFKHECYPGTDIPKNFASLISIIPLENSNEYDPTISTPTRQAFIYMNHPLRYAGYTFYQASFGNGNKASMLQVVKNPSRWLPYISVALVGVGLLGHFLLRLTIYILQRRQV